MKKTTNITATVVRLILAGAAITLIIISMVTDQMMPYLPLGLGLTAIANVINCIAIKASKGNKNGSTEDRCVS